MTPEEKAQVQLETRLECSRIAALECQYWGTVDMDDDRPHIADISLGAMGASANICAAIFLDKTEAQVKFEIAGRPKGGVA